MFLVVNLFFLVSPLATDVFFARNALLALFSKLLAAAFKKKRCHLHILKFGNELVSFKIKKGSIKKMAGKRPERLM